jgi:hypothetical protein
VLNIDEEKNLELFIKINNLKSKHKNYKLKYAYHSRNYYYLLFVICYFLFLK